MTVRAHLSLLAQLLHAVLERASSGLTELLAHIHASGPTLSFPAEEPA
ncbi:hypothetical protein HNR42_001518 [Deinobacterium chartae]|uniref:Uncharacterized protein n=1 Tax=Deinobacterium chartae TaxID=521158 RepID=A0A841HYW8_9DEIO|nr:hypothetical protein [Deinobacterium chartae]MBB6098093.1 hypothetical protein [Deinobacterium chartae]